MLPVKTILSGLSKELETNFGEVGDALLGLCCAAAVVCSEGHRLPNAFHGTRETEFILLSFVIISV